MSAGAVVRVALLGAAGRMGRAVREVARDFPGVEIAAAVTRTGRAAAEPDSGILHTQVLRDALAASDVLLDFSRPEATAEALETCVAGSKPLVIGVTGLDAELQKKIAQAAKHIAVLLAPNMSLGANLLVALARTAARSLGAEFDIEILEAHHRGKRDAPSGTALAIGEAVAEARGTLLAEQAVFARQGRSGPRQPGSIGFAVLRGGDLAGEHTVLFVGEGERLELTHRAASRAAFARGALTAAHWLADRPPGLYGMAEVLGLPQPA